jgi:cytochrome c-type biogenesis protein CcmH/NrfG
LWISIGIACVFAVIGKLVQPPVMADLPPLFMRPLIATDVMAFDLFKLIFPLHLAPDYGRTPRVAIAHGWVYWTWIAPLAFAIAVWFMRKRSPGLVAGALLALIGVAPVLGLVPFTFQAYSTVADHYLYPSMLGISLIVASVLSRAGLKWIPLAGAFVILLATLSFITAGFWRNTQTLFTHTLDINPRSFLAYTNRAVDHIHREEFDAAYDDLRRAVEINPNYAFAHLDLAELLLKRNDTAGALAEFREVLRVYSTQRNFDPKLASSSARVIATLLAQRGEYTQASQILQDALEHDPGNQQLSQLLSAMRSRAATKP